MKWILPNWPFYAGQMVFLVASNTSHVLYSWLFISFSDKTVSLISLVTFTRYGDGAGTMTRKTPAASAWTECTRCHQQGHVGLKHCSNKIFLLGLVRDYIFKGLMTFPSITSISVLTKTFMKPEVDGKLAYMHAVMCTCTDNHQHNASSPMNITGRCITNEKISSYITGLWIRCNDDAWCDIAARQSLIQFLSNVRHEWWQQPKTSINACIHNVLTDVDFGRALRLNHGFHIFL